ncbi:zinc-binding dehydrogenase [Deinococcus roseus]|nr:zinc-binding dehydrogenase [Deinococcus roseus]
MRAIQITEPGLDHVIPQNADLPEMKPGDLLVQVKAASLNPVDYKLATNGHPSWQYPHTLGVDGAGEVVQVGSDVQGIEVGAKVFFHADLARSGSFAEYIQVDHRAVTRLPKSWSFEEGAALPCAGLTAYQALVRVCGLKAGQTVVIQGGAGGVGSFAVQIAHALGARVISTASPAKHELVRSLGADVVIDYRDQNLKEQILQAAGGGVDVVLDTVNRASATRSLELLHPEGQLAFIAGRPEPEAVQNLGYRVHVHDVMLGSAHARQDDAAIRDLSQMGTELAQLVLDGKVKILISEQITLEEIPEWLVKLKAGEVPFGKVVARI